MNLSNNAVRGSRPKSENPVRILLAAIALVDDVGPEPGAVM